jgi:hypothetical protein
MAARRLTQDSAKRAIEMFEKNCQVKRTLMYDNMAYCKTMKTDPTRQWYLRITRHQVEGVIDFQDVQPYRETVQTLRSDERILETF